MPGSKPESTTLAMSHPDSRCEIKVEAEQVPMYASQGWSVLGKK